MWVQFHEVRPPSDSTWSERCRRTRVPTQPVRQLFLSVDNQSPSPRRKAKSTRPVVETNKLESCACDTSHMEFQEAHPGWVWHSPECTASSVVRSRLGLSWWCAAHPESELVERRDRRLEVGRTERHQSELVQPRSEAQCDSWRIAHPESVSV